MDVPLGQIPTVPIRSIGPVQSQSNFNSTLAAVQIAKFANIPLKRYVGSGSQCPKIDLKQTLVFTTRLPEHESPFSTGLKSVRMHTIS